LSVVVVFLFVGISLLTKSNSPEAFYLTIMCKALSLSHQLRQAHCSHESFKLTALLYDSLK